MKISNIELTNFRGIQSMKLCFDEKSTVLFGINGVGKSSILRAVDLLYANIIGTILNSKKRLAELNEDDIYAGKEKAVIAADFQFPGGEKFNYYRSISKLSEKKHMAKNLQALVKKFEEEYISPPYADEEGNLVIPEDDKNMPVFVNYGVNRLVVDVSLKAAKREHFMKINAFDKAIESMIDFTSLFEWFRMQEDLENQEKVRNQDMDYVNRELEAVRKAMLAMLDGFKSVRIERQPLQMIVEKEGVKLNINQLSDGEKCTIALFGDLARRLSLANPALPNPLDGIGVVLIDELELHMHTQWQRKVLGVLRHTFPNIQFIITTHSPQILGEANDDYNIITLKKEGDRIATDIYQSFYGWDSNVILEEAMNTPSMSAEVQKWTAEMYEALEKNELDKAERYAEQIDDVTKGRNESVARVRMLIERKRRYEKDN